MGITERAILVAVQLIVGTYCVFQKESIYKTLGTVNLVFAVMNFVIVILEMNA